MDMSVLELDVKLQLNTTTDSRSELFHYIQIIIVVINTY